MKGLFGFGSPKQQRFSMQFGYAVRPSFWQELKANSHLVIAAVGTMALLGIAGTALWLAMPSGERPAFAEPKPQADVAKVKPLTVEPAQTVAATGSMTTDAASVVSSQAAPKADAVRPAETAGADVAALPRNDPRWTGEGKPAAIDAKAVAADTGDGTQTAFAEEDGATDAQAAIKPSAADDEAAAEPHADPDPKAATAAIPAAKPEPPAEEAGAAANGHILRAVTMRSGPKKGAAAIGTIPAKTAVQVISCKSWCEVVYKGRHGFIYKSFLKRGG